MMHSLNIQAITETLFSFKIFNFCNLFIQRFSGNKEVLKYANTDTV